MALVNGQAIGESENPRVVGRNRTWVLGVVGARTLPLGHPLEEKGELYTIITKTILLLIVRQKYMTNYFY